MLKLPKLCHLTSGIVLILILLTSSGFSAQQNHDKAKALEKITYCYGGAAPALLSLAVEHGLFRQAGLDVTIKSFPLGTNALDELLAGNCDVANSAETPVVIKSFQRTDLRIISTVRSSENLGQIVGRKDRGIKIARDLKGQRIGIPKGTVPHFFLNLELARHGLSEKNIHPVFMETGKLLASLSEGSVDAIATTNAMAFKAKQKLGNKVTVIQNPGLCRNYSLLVTMQGYASKHPEHIQQLLKALYVADQLNKQSPQKSRERIIAAMKLSTAEYDAVWKEYDDRLIINNGLLLGLEEQARWIIEKRLTTATRIPNYLTIIDASHLRKAAPEAVRLRR